MTKNRYGKTGDVVERLPILACFGVSRPFDAKSRAVWQRITVLWITGLRIVGSRIAGRQMAGRLKKPSTFSAAALLLLAVLLLCIIPVGTAFADSGQGAPPQITATDNITDTQNLLGDNVAAVTDAINKTKSESGVTVKLLYIESFGNNAKPDKWASDVLESTRPAPNTVMLAVASGDGNLVVVVSPKSDEWLSSKKTADALSQAALEPLTAKDTPDWSGSAIAMMNELDTLSKTSTSSGASRIGAGLMVAIPVVLLAVVVAAIVLRRRRAAAADESASAGAVPDAAASDTAVPDVDVPDEAEPDVAISSDTGDNKSTAESAAQSDTPRRRSGRHRR
jgi:hypothetical protein